MATPTYTSEPLIVEEIDTSEAEIPIHLCCRACYPEDVDLFTSYGICGALLLGIDAPQGSTNCDICIEGWAAHRRGHPKDGE